MGKAANFTKEQILTAIKNSYGIVSNVAKKLKCDWNTARKYIDKYECTLQAEEDERKKYVDLAESNSVELLKSGDPQQTRYVLSTVGKDRGYTDKTEIDTKVSGNLEIKINVNGK